MIGRHEITGLVLAGGRGSRMGGVDKGLERHAGIALARHALLRLAPQVGAIAFNANRNLAAYRALGAEAWPDVLADQPGPLAGILTGCERCATPYLATVPCDAPCFPLDLVERLAAALDSAGAEVAIAATAERDGWRRQPVFGLVRTSLASDLRRAIEDGQRQVGAWAVSRRCIEVAFADAAAFVNVNTELELRQLPAER